MTYTIHDVIKLIPIGPELRTELETQFDTYEEGKKLEVRMALWDVFNTFNDRLVQMKLQQMMDEVQAGKRHLSSNMTQEARQEVEKTFQDILSGKTVEQQEMDEIRNKIQSLIVQGSTT